MASTSSPRSSELDTKDLMPSLRNLEIGKDSSPSQGEKTYEKNAGSCSPARIPQTSSKSTASNPRHLDMSGHREAFGSRIRASDIPPRGFYGKVKCRRKLRGRNAPMGDTLSPEVKSSSRTKRKKTRTTEKKQIKEIISKFSKLDTKEDAVARRDRELQKLLMEEMESELIFMLSKGCVVTDQPAKFMPYIC
mmetsp:Transcript_4190/g.8328  ORF Transcript_4190/g.8328 Transcript_4190/m.8328 type:complete len:192 (-) Transcript_4190:198-773(-)